MARPARPTQAKPSRGKSPARSNGRPKAASRNGRSRGGVAAATPAAAPTASPADAASLGEALARVEARLISLEHTLAACHMLLRDLHGVPFRLDELERTVGQALGRMSDFVYRMRLPPTPFNTARMPVPLPSI